MYWCSRKQKRLPQTKSFPSESTPFSPTNFKASRPKEIVLIPIIPNLVHLNTSDINDNTSSSSSTTNDSSKKLRKNLLQQR